jgi:hypothetical protein
MPNPTGKGLKPNKPGERRGGRQAGTRDLRTLVREAAEETGLIERVPVLDKEGKPTGRYEFRYGAEGEKGYLKWVARNHPGHFMALYGKLLPLEVNQKVEEKAVVRYETVEERRAAMLAKGWHPSALAALEEAMEPKFLLEHGLLAAGDHRQLARQHEVDFLRRRSVRPGAAPGQEMRYADDEVPRAAGLCAEQAQRRATAMIGGIIGLGLGETLHLHQSFSPFSIR